MELTNLGDAVPSEHGHRSRCRSGGLLTPKSQPEVPFQVWSQVTCQVMSKEAGLCPGPGGDVTLLGRPRRQPGDCVHGNAQVLLVLFLNHISNEMNLI